MFLNNPVVSKEIEGKRKNQPMSCVFSIVMATYNGASKLPATLRALSLLDLEGTVELIIINNASTDNTEQMATEVWSRLGCPFPLYIYCQPLAGKSRALEMAAKKVSGEYTLICDDDNHLYPDYLTVALETFNSQPTSMGACGGQAKPVSPIDLPDWFEKVAYLYACGNRSEFLVDFTGKKFLWGAGMVIKSHLFKAICSINSPQLLTCRKGDLLISGGDDEICIRLWLLGYSTVYNPKLKLAHFMPETRLTLAYKEKLLQGFQHQSRLINCYRYLYTCSQYTSNFYFILVKKFFGWLINKLRRNDDVALIQNDMLFFLTRLSIFENEINKAVWQWYETVAIPELVKSGNWNFLTKPTKKSR